MIPEMAGGAGTRSGVPVRLSGVVSAGRGSRGSSGEEADVDRWMETEVSVQVVGAAGIGELFKRGAWKRERLHLSHILLGPLQQMRLLITRTS